MLSLNAALCRLKGSVVLCTDETLQWYCMLHKGAHLVNILLGLLELCGIGQEQKKIFGVIPVSPNCSLLSPGHGLLALLIRTGNPENWLRQKQQRDHGSMSLTSSYTILYRRRGKKKTKEVKYIAIPDPHPPTQ